MKKIYLLLVAVATSFASFSQDIYKLDFESGLNNESIYANGAIVADDTAGFGNVYYNVTETGTIGIRTNWLELDASFLTTINSNAAAGDSAFSIGFWVTAHDSAARANEIAGYYYSPLFTAYNTNTAGADNGIPMFVVEARGWMQINTNDEDNGEWSDFALDFETTTGSVTESTDYLTDGAWHFVACTFTPQTAVFYVDADTVNAYEFDGYSAGQNIKGLFNGKLTYPCLGGNQGWGWGDTDAPFKYDDFGVWSHILTPEEITAHMARKRGTYTSIPTEIVSSNVTVVGVEYYTITGARLGADVESFDSGIYIKRSLMSDGTSKGEKIMIQK